MADINLLSEETRQLESFENLRKKLSVVSVLMLVITAIGTLATLAFFTTLVSERGKLIERVEESSAKVNSYKAVEELAVVTKEKVSLSEQIISKRSDKVVLFNNLASLVPQNVSFSDVKISQGKIVLTGRAKTSADVAAFISALVSAKGTQVVSNTSVDSLVSDEAGVYSFGVSANLAN